ncbi:uncharacterized protein H6S33_010818 [Morchella sextelata]|uniref:uncharacterized protein n=1 Tax=Morchella sextelata TaxID=1174677 RepID=UPI001D038DA2|nr:uncharacterized protein H6S33_010818 [Morchella sextelata]KAH0611553.1 hypothetical protein H6S33_010818 [Morchella sextelata]
MSRPRDNMGRGQGNYGIGLSERKDSRAFKKLYDDIATNFDSAHQYKALLNEEIRLNKKALEDLLDFNDNGNPTIDNSHAEALHRQRNELQVRYNNVEFAWAQSVKQAYQKVWEASQTLARACDIAKRAIIADTTGGGTDPVAGGGQENFGFQANKNIPHRRALCPPPPPPPPPSPPRPPPPPPPPPPPGRANSTDARQVPPVGPARDEYGVPRGQKRHQGSEKCLYTPSVPTKMRNADDIDSLTLLGEVPPPLKGQFVRQAQSAQPLRRSSSQQVTRATQLAAKASSAEASSAQPTRRMSTLDVRSAPPSRASQSRASSTTRVPRSNTPTPSHVPAWKFSATKSGNPMSSGLSNDVSTESLNKRMKFTFSSIIEKIPNAGNENLNPKGRGEDVSIASKLSGTGSEPGEIRESLRERFSLTENPYHRHSTAQSASSADSFESRRR